MNAKVTKRPAKQTKLIGPHRLLGDSLKFIKFHWRPLGKVVLAGALINLLLQLASSADMGSVYKSLWFVFYSCAILWTVRHLEDTGTAVSLRAAYYQGTAPALKFFLTLILIGLVSIPFSVGAFIYGTLGASAGANPELIGVGLVWLLLGLITIFLLARTLLALVIITLPNITPLESFKLSWRLTKGRANSLAWRLLVPFAYFGLSSLVIVLLASLVKLNTVPEALVELFLNVTILPLLYIYVYKLYRQLT